MIKSKKFRMPYLLYLSIFFILGWSVGDKLNINITALHVLNFDILKVGVIIVLIELIFLTIGIISITLRRLDPSEEIKQLNHVKIIAFLIIIEVLGLIIYKFQNIF